MNLLSSDDETEKTFKSPLPLSKDKITAHKPDKTTSTLEKSHNSQDFNRLSINKSYAKQYQERKQKEQLSNSKHLLKSLDDSDDESTSEEEDEKAELLTDDIEKKIFKTLTSIKKKDPTIYNPDHKFFNDKDFENILLNDENNQTQKKKPMTYKDYVRENLTKFGATGLELSDSEEPKFSKKPQTYIEEQQELKNAFLRAADESLVYDQEETFLKAKTKSYAETKREEEDFQNFLKGNRNLNNTDADNIIRNYWADDDTLDEKQKFLRDYILQEKWKEDPNEFNFEEIDEEQDESHLEKVDEFEYQYNFRFEEEGGTKIQGHSRKTPDSVRQKEQKRKRKREETRFRKEEEKQNKKDELKRLKILKKKEILDRINKIKQVYGEEELKTEFIDLISDFDPQKHDNDMNKLFDKFEERVETLPKKEILKVPDGLSKELDVSDVKNLDFSIMTKKQKRLAKLLKKKTALLDDGLPYAPITENNNHDENVNENYEDYYHNDDGEFNSETGVPDDSNVDNNLWWLCDNCQKGIPTGQKVFECNSCDFSLCLKCRGTTVHEHPLKKRKVPAECQPPEEYLKQGDEGAKTIDSFLDELLEMDYEDIIGGDLPTRFKYEKVNPNTFGFTIEEILSKEDKELNKAISLKKLAAYRNDEKITRKQLKAQLWHKNNPIKKSTCSKNKKKPSNTTNGEVPIKVSTKAVTTS